MVSLLNRCVKTNSIKYYNKAISLRETLICRAIILTANVIYTCLNLHCMLCIHSSASSLLVLFFSLSVYHFLLPVFPAIQVAVPSLSFIYLARAFMFLGVPAAISPPFSPLLNLNQLFSFGPLFFLHFSANVC